MFTSAKGRLLLTNSLGVLLKEILALNTIQYNTKQCNISFNKVKAQKHKCSFKIRTGIKSTIKYMIWWRDSANVFTFLLFRSCYDSFGSLQLFCFHILPCAQLRVTNCTVVTSQLNPHHVIWIGWQYGHKHVSRICLRYVHMNKMRTSKILRFVRGKSANHDSILCLSNFEYFVIARTMKAIV